MSDEIERRFTAEGTEIGPVRIGGAVGRATLGTERHKGRYFWQGEWRPLANAENAENAENEREPASDIEAFKHLLDAMGADLTARQGASTMKRKP